MLAEFVLWSLALTGPAASTQTVDRTSPEACRVLESAYTTAIGAQLPVHPIDVRPEPFRLELRKFVPPAVERMQFRAGEFDDLVSRDAGEAADDFQPACTWKGVPSPKIDEEGHRMSVSFTDPIFSTDRRLAVTQVSFREEGRFGFGMVCVARLEGDRWTARCLQSWIT